MRSRSLVPALLLSTSLIVSCNTDMTFSDRNPRRHGASDYLRPLSTGLPVSAPSEQGIDAQGLLDAYRFVESSPELNPYMLSLLVVRHGYLVAERFYQGDGPETAFNVKSVSKSFLSALTGIAIDQGHLTGVDQSIAPFFAEYLGEGPGPPLSDVTVRHLLLHTAGFRWEESGVIHLGWIFSDDWNAYTLGLPFDADPGSTFNYTTAGTHLLATVLARATGQPLLDFAQAALFQPTDIEISRWDTDPQGNYIGGKDMYFRAIDLAKFGVLFARGGLCDSLRVVSENWVAESTSEQILVEGEGGYGYLWWRWVTRGHESYYAAGMGGQYIFVVPDLDLVVVVTSTLDSKSAYHGSVLAFVDRQILPTVSW